MYEIYAEFKRGIVLRKFSWINDYFLLNLKLSSIKISLLKFEMLGRGFLPAGLYILPKPLYILSVLSYLFLKY